MTSAAITVPKGITRKEVDELLLGNRPLADLKARFDDQEALLNFYAQRMAELFPLKQPLNACEACRQHAAEFRIFCVWRGFYVTAKKAIANLIASAVMIPLLHHFSVSSNHVDFSTTHGLCTVCYKRIKRRRTIATVVKQLCLGVIVLAAMLVAAAIVISIFAVYPQRNGELMATAIICLCSGLFLLPAGLLSIDQVVRWCLPPSLRRIAKPPFEPVAFRQSSQ